MIVYVMRDLHSGLLLTKNDLLTIIKPIQEIVKEKTVFFTEKRVTILSQVCAKITDALAAVVEKCEFLLHKLRECDTMRKETETEVCT